MLQIKGISKSFGNFKALNQVDLDIATGEFFTLLGPSGCGKTTLLRIIAGFESPDSGDILLDGSSIIDMPSEHRPIHTVFQNYAIFPHMTVAQNIAFPLQMSGVNREEIVVRVQEALENVHLPNKANAFPAELSGGQRQRIAIARSLVNRPRLLLLDEPLSALDAKMREQMQIELINLQKEVGITFIYVTHDQSEALALSHRIAVMNKGDISQLDKPASIYNFPTNRFVADFIGQCNLLEGAIVQANNDLAEVALKHLGPIRVQLNEETRATTGQPCLIAIRPEKIRIGRNLQISDQEVVFTGQVHDILYRGEVTVYKVELADGLQLEALLANSCWNQGSSFNLGDAVDVAWSITSGHLILEL